MPLLASKLTDKEYQEKVAAALDSLWREPKSPDLRTNIHLPIGGEAQRVALARALVNKPALSAG